MAEQLTHDNTHFTAVKTPTILVCDGVISPANIGGLFRLCDSFGIQKIYFCGTKIDLSSPRIKRTSRSTHLLVNYKDDLDTLEVLKQLTKQGYKPLALELTTKSKALEDLDIPEKRPVALFIGNEKTGISSKVLASIPTHVHIPMQGNNSSMNVTQAAAIGLYGLSLKIKEI
jgi:tRNA G18 (ribose-2'-O)-methylase SpoU